MSAAPRLTPSFPLSESVKLKYSATSFLYWIAAQLRGANTHSGVSSSVLSDTFGLKLIAVWNKGLDIITFNMDLYTADRKLYEESDDTSEDLLAALNLVRNDYDFCIIDNGPAVDMVTLNVLRAANDVLIPIRPDEFSFSGLLDLVEQVRAVQEGINSRLTLRGAFFTHWQNWEPFVQARQSLVDSGICPVYCVG